MTSSAQPSSSSSSSLATTRPSSKPLPPPLDDPSVSIPLLLFDDDCDENNNFCPPLNWGMIGCGRVCHDFVQALKHLPTAKVVACATANDPIRAAEFATKHKIPTSYGNYDDLLKDKDVQIVYVGNLHVVRRTIGEKCLNAGKHVLLEKPFAMSYDDALYLINLAKEKNLFIMEGMWTRFFPAVEQARRLALGSNSDKTSITASEEGNSDGRSSSGGIIGEIVSVISEFNFNASDSDEYPTSFFYNRKLGGGASYLVGPYPFAAATLFFNGAEPDTIKVVGQVDEQTGVDLQAALIMTFPPTSSIPPAMDSNNETENTAKLPGSGLAMCSYGFLGESEEQTTVIGTKGRLVIDTPAHCPTKLRLTLKATGRGQIDGETVFYYPLPDDTDEIKNAGGFVYPNSAGFAYEAAAVARCIAAGKTEAPQFTHAETLCNAKLIDESRKQLGVKPVDQD